MTIKMEWEELDNGGHSGSIFRAKVPGGWLYKNVDPVMTVMPSGLLDSGYEWRTTICFVPNLEEEIRVTGMIDNVISTMEDLKDFVPVR